MKVRRLALLLCLATSVVALPVGQAFAAPKKPAAAPAEPAPVVEPAALEALDKMSAYLRTLQAFQVSSDTMREEVNDNGQKLQFLGSVTYKVRRPNGFVIETVEDRRIRKVFYDGKSLTLFAPRMNYYATVPAPATIHEVLEVAANKYGLTIPLEDLFAWGTAEDRHKELKVGYLVGYARVAGQDADQYAFRQAGVDWQIWIARGEKPLPLRVVITGTNDPTQPQYESTLTWNTTAQFASDAFVFTPPPDAKAITFAVASK